MADDPQFSLSKTYFWALQAYKLFEVSLILVSLSSNGSFRHGFAKRTSSLQLLVTNDMLQKTLLDTIGTWRSFKEHSLPKLRDGRINPEDWLTSIQDIDDAIAQLENKVSRIRTRMAEVKDLRTGVSSTMFSYMSIANHHIIIAHISVRSL